MNGFVAEAAARSIDVTEAARHLRAALKSAFPGVKFSVRSSRYSMGCSIDVAWTDGPSRAAVAPVADRFQGKDFDGMTDSTSYRGPIEVNGEMVRLPGCYVQTRRTISGEATRIEAARAWLADHDAGAASAIHDYAAQMVRQAEPGEEIEAVYRRVVLREDA